MLQLIIVIAISCLTLSSGIVHFKQFTHTHNAKLALQQLQQAINFARSEAILHRQVVKIVLEQDSLLVIAPNTKARVFKNYLNSEQLIMLQQSGNSNKQVTVQANGLSFNNGSFRLISLNSSYIANYTLYFNKALRVYVSTDN